LSKGKSAFVIVIAILSAIVAPTFVKAQTGNGVTFVLGTTTVIGLNPMTSYSYGMFFSALYSSLFRFDANLQPQPWLAQSYSRPNDTSWVVNLRHDAVWHDGQPVTSQDVKFTLNLIQQAGGVEARFVQGIVDIETPDTYTVVVRVAQPTLIAGWLTSVYILPQHYWVAQGAVGASALNFTNNPPIGSGPFKFVSWTPGESVTFQAFDNFFGGRPKIDTLIIRQFATETDMVAALKSGDLDAADQVLLTDATALKQIPGLSVTPTEISDIIDIYINLNTNHSQGNPTLLDKNVRLALMYATNRTYLNEQVENGLMTPALSIIPDIYGPYFAKEDLPMLQFNLTLANQILDQAGYKKGSDGIRVSPSGVKLSYRYYIYNGFPEMVRAAQIIKGWWNQIGVDITYQAMEGGTLWNTVANPPYNWDLAVWGWTVHDVSSIIYSYTSAAVGVFSSSGLSDPTFDAMYQAQLHETNETQRISAVHDVQTYMLQNAVEITLFYQNVLTTYWASKWTGVINQPWGAFNMYGQNSEMFLYLQSVSSASSATTMAPATNSTSAPPPAAGTDYTTPGIILVVVIIILGAAVYLRRRKPPETPAKK
jgi:peptide/nickel transport system substrate-binding protein